MCFINIVVYAAEDEKLCFENDSGRKEMKRMKAGIHPDYKKVVFMDTNTGFKFLSGSTRGSNETVEWEDGNTYPLLKVEISSDSHPFYTGRQKFATADGRVDRFNKKYGLNKNIKQAVYLFACLFLRKYYTFTLLLIKK